MFLLVVQIRCNRNPSLAHFCTVAQSFLTSCSQEVLGRCFCPAHTSAILRAQRESIRRRIVSEQLAENDDGAAPPPPAECSEFLEVAATAVDTTADQISGDSCSNVQTAARLGISGGSSEAFNLRLS
jgi:hypothetical protein